MSLIQLSLFSIVYLLVFVKGRFIHSKLKTEVSRNVSVVDENEPSLSGWRSCNENGRWEKDSTGNMVCKCFPEFGMRALECTACDCGKNANCTFDVEIIYIIRYCHCPNGEILKYERCKDPCESNPCKNGGRCYTEDGINPICRCTGIYSGPYCDRDTVTDYTADFSTSTLWHRSTYNTETGSQDTEYPTSESSLWSESTYQTETGSQDTTTEPSLAKRMFIVLEI